MEVPHGQTHTGLMSSWLWGWTILCYVQMFGRTFRPDLSIWFFGLVWGFFLGGRGRTNWGINLTPKQDSCRAQWVHPGCLGRAPLLTAFKEWYFTCFWTTSIVGHKTFLTLCQKSTYRASTALRATGYNNERGGTLKRSWKVFMKCIMVDCLKLLELIFNSYTL